MLHVAVVEVGVRAPVTFLIRLTRGFPRVIIRATLTGRGIWKQLPRQRTHPSYVTTRDILSSARERLTGVPAC
jgi:hypothetical protein